MKRTRPIALTALCAILLSGPLATSASAADSAAQAASDDIADAVSAVTTPELATDDSAAVAKRDGSFVSDGEGADATIPRDAAGAAQVVAETESGERVSASVGIGGDGSARGSLASDGSVVYAGEGSTAATVQPTDDGLRIHTVISDASAPTQFVHEVSLSPGLQMVMMRDLPKQADPAGGAAQQTGADDGVAILDAQGRLVGGFAPPWAKDANGTDIPTHYELRAGALVQFVDHTGPDVAYPVVADPWLGFDLISWAKWAWHSDGWTLEVTPTGWARAQAGAYAVGAAGWDELYAKYKNRGRGLKRNLDGMRDQYICHQQVVAIRSPRKATWNLDEWRPDVSYLDTVNAQCNPGGARVFD